ncbi:hypothetical protein SAMN04488105_13326 [Salipiger thiooxidans]|uniref:Uncharacterized protein n=1 Tax=Salipiger thiooxidans TaxID=282683 RepID=A0A1G7MFQ4_9RHOB|nr:hypothetical protein SAMN04488105_13326 [Salipiger thiooxidans]
MRRRANPAQSPVAMRDSPEALSGTVFRMFGLLTSYVLLRGIETGARPVSRIAKHA